MCNLFIYFITMLVKTCHVIVLLNTKAKKHISNGMTNNTHFLTLGIDNAYLKHKDPKCLVGKF